MMSSILSPAAILAARTKPSRAVAYYRSSREAPHSQKALALQYRSILTWASQQNFDIIHEFVDGSHPTSDLSTQPGLAELLEWVQHRSDFTLILCHDESRLSRSREQLASLLATCTVHEKQVIFTAHWPSTEGVSQ